MIEIYSAVLIGILLLLLLGLLGTRGASPSGEWALRSGALFSDGEDEVVPCPPQFVRRIFSDEDQKFVLNMKSPKIAKLFRKERKGVALLWVLQTSAAIQGVMRNHVQASRENEDLEFRTEMKVVLQYAELMLMCGLLFVAIQSTGPLWLRGLAMHADALCHRIARAQRSLAAATADRSMQSVGS